MARYIAEELLAESHEVVVISRSKKAWFDRKDIDFRLTDYSVPSLAQCLSDCDGLISAILDYSMNSATAHLALLEACLQSPRCKRFIPSEYAGNTDEYPDQPIFYAANHNPVREALRAQSDVMWTLFNLGWLTDYLVPAKSRYIKDIGAYHPVNFTAGTVAIPGTGDERIAFTAARDGAKALARLMKCDAWEPTTYVCGETTTWNHIADVLAARGYKLQRSHRPAELLLQEMKDAETEDQVIAAQYDLWSISGAGLLPEEKVRRHAETFFKGVRFRCVEEVLDDAARRPDVAV